MAKSIPLVILAVGVFSVVSTNTLFPVGSSKNLEFFELVGYHVVDLLQGEDAASGLIRDVVINSLHREDAAPDLIGDFEQIYTAVDSKDWMDLIDRGESNASNNYSRYASYPGPRQLYYVEDKPHDVTLTFYIRQGEQTDNIRKLLELLDEYDVKEVIFFVDNEFRASHEFLVRTIELQGYDVRIWNDLDGYAEELGPSSYLDVLLSEKEIFSQVSTDKDAAEILKIGLGSRQSSIVAFTPKIMTHKMVLESLLLQAGKSLEFVSSDIIKGDRPSTSAGEIAQRDPLIESIPVRASIISLSSGKWNLESLSARYPSSVRHLESADGYLITSSILIGNNASLTLDNQNVLLSSPSEKAGSPVGIEVRGEAVISNSVVTSWDISHSLPNLNQYSPRPYIIVRNGDMNIFNSTFAHLGYSIAGLNDTRAGHAALEFKNVMGMTIEKSTIAHSFRGVLIEDSNDIRIVDSEILGNSKQGLDLRRSSVVMVHSNLITDNGMQGISCTQCSNLTLSENVVEHNGAGAGLSEITGSIIAGNLIQYNEAAGISVQDRSRNNIIQDNALSANGNGISVGDNSLENVMNDNTISDGILHDDSK